MNLQEPNNKPLTLTVLLMEGLSMFSGWSNLETRNSDFATSDRVPPHRATGIAYPGQSRA
jgi:hypothetical protein